MYKYTYVRGDWAPVASREPSVGPPVASPRSPDVCCSLCRNATTP